MKSQSIDTKIHHCSTRQNWLYANRKLRKTLQNEARRDFQNDVEVSSQYSNSGKPEYNRLIWIAQGILRESLILKHSKFSYNHKIKD
jgi:hypothetical protein